MVNLSLKHGVRFEGMSYEIMFAVLSVMRVFNGFGVDVVITSGTDGVHKTESKHYSGNAIDVRIWALSQMDRLKIVSVLSSKLGVNYDVVLESTHIHIEFDPK